MTLTRLVGVPLLTLTSLMISFALLPLKPLSAANATAQVQPASADLLKAGAPNGR